MDEDYSAEKSLFASAVKGTWRRINQLIKACVPQLRKAYVPQQCMGGTWRRINQLRKAYLPQQ
jgi:hypothetical protein